MLYECYCYGDNCDLSVQGKEGEVEAVKEQLAEVEKQRESSEASIAKLKQV